VSFVLERHTPHPPTTANKYAGLSLPARRRVVRDWRKWAKDEAVDRGWSSITVPVSVDVVHLRPNHASMPDVTALQPVAKALVDGLVDAKVLAGHGSHTARSRPASPSSTSAPSWTPCTRSGTRPSATRE
jgi:hypothetical protein